MFSKIVIATFFRVANCVALLLFLTYLFKKYAMPAIAFLMAQREQEHQSLVHQKVDLEAEQSLMEKAIEDDALLCVLLKQRVDEWKKTADEECLMRDNEQKKLAAFVLERAEQRARTREEERVYQIVQTKVVNDLEKSLSLFFTQDAEAKYLRAIIHCMNERQ